MKTYTFKIKLHYASENHPVVLSVIHCPLEVLFDSLKGVKQFDELFKNVKDENNKEVPSMYITASDYLTESGFYVYDDCILCEYTAIIDSNSLKEFLTHCDYYGFVSTDLTCVKTEKELVNNSFNFYLKAISENDKQENEETEDDEV